MLAYLAEMSLAATYSLHRPKLARKCAAAAHAEALRLRRPDLAYKANDLMAAL